MGRDAFDQIGEDISLEECVEEPPVKMRKMSRRSLHMRHRGCAGGAVSIEDQAAKSTDRRRVKVTLPKIEPDA